MHKFLCEYSPWCTSRSSKHCLFIFVSFFLVLFKVQLVGKNQRENAGKRTRLNKYYKTTIYNKVRRDYRRRRFVIVSVTTHCLTLEGYQEPNFDHKRRKRLTFLVKITVFSHHFRGLLRVIYLTVSCHHHYHHHLPNVGS